MFILTIIFYACEKKENSFTFIIAADMRYMATEEYRDSRYFQGACEAIKKYGKGSFLISPGDDSLNKYPQNSFKFHQLLKKYNVNAYVCGHTHNASIAKINNIWQIDIGHARGIESYFPDMLIGEILQKIEQGKKIGLTEKESISDYYEGNDYEARKVLYYTDLTGGISYKKIDDKTGLDLLLTFVDYYSNDKKMWEKHKTAFWTNANLTRSTFLKVITSENDVTVEFYRDDARGGEYNLMHSYSLN